MKKIMVVLVFFVGLVLISTVPLVAANPCGRCGDANGDGSIDISDPSFIISYLNGGPAPNPLCSADVNGDGVVNYADANGIILFLNQGFPFVNDCCTQGDANGDLTIDISDVVYIIHYIFGGGPAPDQPCMGDINQDGVVDISDAVFLIHYIFDS
jgi:hypothetical protein